MKNFILALSLFISVSARAENMDMTRDQYDTWVSGWATVTDLRNGFIAARTAAGNPAGTQAPGSVAVPNAGYGTQQSRADIVTTNILPLVNPPVKADQINATSVRDAVLGLFQINNAALARRLGVTFNDANNKLIATVALPINQAQLNAAVTARTNALNNYNANKTEANAVAYWSAVRTVALKQGFVDATQYLIDNNGAFPAP